MKQYQTIKTISLVAFVTLLITVLVSCVSPISWVDADGEVLETYLPEEDEVIQERNLPADDDDWHYTGWTETKKWGKTVYVAERIAKTKIIWHDTDGSVLHTASIIPDSEIPVKDLPLDTDEWHYTEWIQSEDDGKILFTAARIPMIRVTWLDADGTVLYAASVAPNRDIPTQNMPLDTEDWLYTGWKEEIGENKVTYTALRTAKTKIEWRDTDGTLLAKQSIHPSSQVPSRELPKNNESWIYTEWSKNQTDNLITFTAKRIEAKTVIWVDGDGKQLEKLFLPVGDRIPTRDLPKSNKWDYTEWVETVSGEANKVYTYTAKGEPKLSYFAGNVFQIVATDLAGNPMMIGTGFVINKDGWFVTNYHVIENAFLANAIFEIRNYATNESFTTLEVDGISFFDKDKDLAIGRLKNYNTIASNYNKISFDFKYEVGDKTYSVGYPNAVKNMEMHEGKILENLADLADKLYGGVKYIASDSYVAPGSSGGILINENLEVIGLVTRGLWDEDDNFVLGAAIEAFNLQGLITQKTKGSMLKNVGVAQFPEAKNYVTFFEKLKNNRSAKLITSEEGVKYYELVEKYSGYASGGVYYEDVYTYTFFGTGEIVAQYVVTWDDGEERAELLYGNYLDGWDSFYYVFGYEWDDGRGYYLYSENINYSLNIDATLRNYEIESLRGYKPSAENIRYAKEQFNSLYKKTVNMVD